MRKLDFTTYFSTNIGENAKIIFFLENVPRQAKKWPPIRQWQIVTHMEKLITFREPHGLIQMYVIAAVAYFGPNQHTGSPEKTKINFKTSLNTIL